MTQKWLFIAGGLAVVAGLIHYRRRRKRDLAIKKKVDQLFQILDQPNVVISDPAVLRGILYHLVKDGPNKLQILSDFDMTLSKYWIDGKRGYSCHAVIEKGSCMPEEFRERAAAIKAKFYPMEMSPHLTREQKIPLMVEWWTAIHNAIIAAGFKREWLTGLVSEALIELRDGAKEFLLFLQAIKVPVVLFSAGVGDVIEETLAAAECPISGLNIISNYMDFNEQGHLIGFRTELIHSYNKHDISIHWHDYFDKTRPNDILLGDTVGDTSMADGLDKGGTTLKIAFLNDQVEQLLEHYKEAYDIIICEDQTIDTVHVLLKEMLL